MAKVPKKNVDIDLTGDDDAAAQKRKLQKRNSSGGSNRQQEVVVLSDSDEEVVTNRASSAAEVPSSSGRRSDARRMAPPVVQPPPREQLPPWVGMNGAKRVAVELKLLSQEVERGTAPVYDLQTVGDNICKWQMKMKDFDPDMPGGRDLNDDLAKLKRKTGQDYLQLEINFPSTYPNQPFALRLVSPRCAWYTGHVTAGGSICVEALSQTGSKNSWKADYCVSGLLPMVKQNMIDVEAVYIRTASGPGGMAGPLRVDLDARWGVPVNIPYSESEARAAFARAEAHHRTNGW